MTLVTDGIAEITEKGVVTVDGTEHEVDVLIYGTGFQASKFLTPMKVTGRGGVDLHERGDGDARAYLGMTVPGFPNLFLLYGPNTNIVVNGSDHLLLRVRGALHGGVHPHAARPGTGRWTSGQEVHDAYNERDRRGQPAHGLGRLRRSTAGTRTSRAGRPELAVPAARVLAAQRAAPTPTTTPADCHGGQGSPTRRCPTVMEGPDRPRPRPAYPHAPPGQVGHSVPDERFEGAAFLGVQRAYPEGWTITVRSVVADGDQAAARVQGRSR